MNVFRAVALEHGILHICFYTAAVIIDLSTLDESSPSRVFQCKNNQQ